MSPGGGQVVEKVLELLDCFTFDQAEFSAAELQQELGLSRSTAYRLLALLAHRGYLRYDPHAKRYQLGHRFLYLGAVAQGRVSLRRVALPFMEQLRDETRESVNLNVIQGGHRVCIERADSPFDLREAILIGRHSPLHTGATGKSLLAFALPDPVGWIEEAASRGELPHPSERLLAEVAEIRRMGYAATTGERVNGAAAISCPVFDHLSTCHAVLTLAGPETRFRDRWSDLIAVAQRTAAAISAALGYRPKEGVAWNSQPHSQESGSST